MVHVLMNKSNGFMTVEKVFASSSDMGAVKAMEITSIVAKNVNIDVETFKMLAVCPKLLVPVAVLSNNTIMIIEQIPVTNSNTVVVRVTRTASKIRNPAKKDVRNKLFKQKQRQTLLSHLLHYLKLFRRARFVILLLILVLAIVISQLFITIHTIICVKHFSMAVVKETRIGSKQKNNVNVFVESFMDKIHVTYHRILVNAEVTSKNTTMIRSIAYVANFHTVDAKVMRTGLAQ